VPQPESPINKTKVAEAAILQLRSDEYSTGWEGQLIKPQLAKALESLGDLQPILDLPSRQKMLQTVLERRDIYSFLLFPELRRARDQQFKELGKFFQSVTLHQQSPLRGEFLTKVSVFENLILYPLTPVTASQQKEITEIIESPPTCAALRFWKSRRKAIDAAAPTAIEKYFPETDSPDDHDPSSYWLEDFKHRTSRTYELEQFLATRLYDIGAKIFSGNDEDRMKNFDDMLRSDPCELFDRLRLQLYADHPERTLQWARTNAFRERILKN